MAETRGMGGALGVRIIVVITTTTASWLLQSIAPSPKTIHFAR